MVTSVRAPSLVNLPALNDLREPASGTRHPYIALLDSISNAAWYVLPASTPLDPRPPMPAVSASLLSYGWRASPQLFLTYSISDDEASDIADFAPPVSKKRVSVASVKATLKDDDDDDVDNEMLDVVGDDNAKDAQDEGGDEDEDLEEDECATPNSFLLLLRYHVLLLTVLDRRYIVEKILAHMVEPDGTLKYKVKWEGYDKKSDQTWEEEDNLRENAAGVLDEYLSSVGGRDTILDEAQTALKTKKRGRPSSGTSTNGTKRRRNESHPASTSPPASSRAWKPPQGSWEDAVESIDACHDENTGKLIVYLTWKTGQKTQHDTKVIYARCPQKMLQFYERHVKIVATGSDTAKDE
ncbi:hypothetical protein RRF57_001607 [Xylaria bambusicola]|uniref:Chromo domain-containing protein n=1 Tax=Xylaria bambusicola TaxID=326684 RepID=A0AAN7UHH8_9PEZI